MKADERAERDGLEDVTKATSSRFDEEVSGITGKSASTIRVEVATAKKLDRAVGEEAAKEIGPTRLGGTKEGVAVIAKVAEAQGADAAIAFAKANADKSAAEAQKSSAKAAS